MTLFQNQKVENLIHDIESISMDQFQIGLAIRELFFKLEQSVTEDVKYGGLIFSCNKEMMSGIFFTKNMFQLNLDKDRNSLIPIPYLKEKVNLGGISRSIIMMKLYQKKSRVLFSRLSINNKKEDFFSCEFVALRVKRIAVETVPLGSQCRMRYKPHHSLYPCGSQTHHILLKGSRKA